MTSLYETSFRLSLAAFPRAFRESYAEEMVLVFRERIIERSMIHRLTFALGELVGALAAGAQMRLSSIAVAQVTVAAYIVVAMLATSAGISDASRNRVSRIDFAGHDPAGKFTITVINGKAEAATLDGVTVPSQRITQHADNISLLGENGSVQLAVRFDRQNGAIGWQARK